MLKEFRDFAVKGNMVDMAIGIIMGGAFGTIIKSLVDDILMPPIGLLIGGVDFSNIKLTLKPAEGDVEAVSMNIGLFFNAVIAFTIVAFALFLVVKAMNKAKEQFEKEKEEGGPATPPRQEVLLEEIRDALKARTA